MRDNFDACLAITLREEGGWADDPHDPGGATMKGITIATFRQYKPGATKADLRAISDTDVAHIYRHGYWDAMHCDELPTGLDLVAFDAAVNSGPHRSAALLQRALGVADDGVIGPATMAAAQSIYGPAAIERAIGFRLSFLKGLKTWPRFGAGWSARCERIRVKALGMAAQGVGVSHAPQTPAAIPTSPTAAKKPASPIAVGGAVGLFTILMGAAVHFSQAMADWWHSLIQAMGF